MLKTGRFSTALQLGHGLRIFFGRPTRLRGRIDRRGTACQPPALSKKKVIATTDAPTAVGPYSQAIAVGNLLFCAGQIPLDPATGNFVGEGDVTAQAERVCQNIAGVLKANGMTFANVVKTTVFLTDLANFGAMNVVYSKYFTEPFPARSTIQVAGLPRGASVEIEVTAAAE